jgi:quinoprotein glucose dehydrogenase
MNVRLLSSVIAGLWTVSVIVTAVQAQASKTVWDGVFTKEQAERGAEAYEKACSECHGKDLAGDGFAPALTNPDFSANWNGTTVGDLFERIRISMPPNGPTGVAPAAKADIVAHILNFNKYPEGKEELKPEAGELKQIAIDAKK